MRPGLLVVYSTVILENIGNLSKVSIHTCACTRTFAFILTVFNDDDSFLDTDFKEIGFLYLNIYEPQ